MSIPYLSPGDSLTAAHWTAIFQQSDALMTSALGGLSAVLAGVDKQWDRSYFFFDPTNPPASLHPVAYNFFVNGPSYGPTNQTALFYRLYSDATIATAMAALTAGTTSAKYGVQIFNVPTFASWTATVYPSGFGALSVAGIKVYNSGVYYIAANALDISLSVVTSAGLAASMQDVTTAEHVQPFKPIDVYVNANFTWLTAWNKYLIVRIHNCGCASIMATFGTITQTIKAGASLCVRNVAGTWVACGNYFHWMESGDARFLQCRETTGGTSPVFQPGIVADVLQEVLTNAIPYNLTNFGGYYDITKFWDLSPIYNNASYSPTQYENTPPSGGYLAPLAHTAILGDLLVCKGNVLVPTRTFTPFRTTLTFAGFGAGFATFTAALTAAGVNYRTLSGTTTLELYYSNGSNRQDLVDLSAALVTFITKGDPAAYCGATQTSNPASLALPGFIFYAPTVTQSTATTNLNYYKWYMSGGQPILSTKETVSVQNAEGSTGISAGQTFYADAAAGPVGTSGTAEDYINTTATAGGVIRINTFYLYSTTFGPILAWDEVWPLQAYFTSVFGSAQNYLITKVIYQPGVGLIVTRARFLNDLSGENTFGIFPPRPNFSDALPIENSSNFMFWNWARTDHRIAFQRFFFHASGDAPVMPNWSSTFGGSAYSCLKYLPAGFFVGPYPYLDDLSLNEYPFVAAFYENLPIGIDEAQTINIGSTTDLTGISRMGQFVKAGDYWALFANWYLSKGDFKYPYFPDLSPSVTVTVATTNNTSDWYSVAVNAGQIIPTINAAPGMPSGFNVAPAWVNVLPCQCEHINTLASIINAEPPMTLTAPSPNGNSTNVTLNFGAGNILIVNGGSGYAVNDGIQFATLAINLKVSSIGAGGVVTGVVQNGAVGLMVCDVYTMPLRPFATTGGSGSGLLIDTSAGTTTSYSSYTGLNYNTSFLPTYAPIGVPVPSGGPITGAFWPRTAYFCWNGPSTVPGGATGYDPVGTYILALAAAAGVTITIQTTLPDSYGAAIFDEHLFWGLTSGVLYASPLANYYGGFNPAFAIQAASYRWISIADARTLYAALSVPFIVNGVFAPMAFTVQQATVTQSYTQSDTPEDSAYFGAYLLFYSGGTPPSSTVQSAYQAMPPGTCWNSPYISPITSLFIGSGFIVPGMAGNWVGGSSVATPVDTEIESVVAGFYNSSGGNWLTTPGANQLRSALPVITPPRPYTTSNQMADNYALVGANWAINPAGIELTYVVHTRTITATLDYGPLNSLVNSFGQPDAYTSLVWLLSGLPQQIAIKVPQNYAYYDPNWVSNNLSVYAALGTEVIPIIADNTVEGDMAEIEIMGNQIDNIITTSLGNARLVTMPIDGTIAGASQSGVGNSPSVPGGAGGAGGSGGNSGGL